MASEDSIGIGSVLGGFKIEKELGRGGMGVVYKGHELSLNRKVAVKVLSQRLCSDKEFVERFKREARVIAALSHPNIVSILSYGEEQGRYYFAMEYISGKDLGQILKEKGSIPLQEALSITAQVASALAEAGPRGVVHRDLKPSNIMIDSMGRAKVTDFGVAHFQDSGAKLTQTGLFLGTPEYASPEQATGRPLDVRSDIYALGAVLYRMLSGKAPITGESPLAVVTKIATEPVTPIRQLNTALPKSVCDLIDKMMAKEPDERFQTPGELTAAIDRCVDSSDIDAPLAKSKVADVGTAPPPPPKQKSRAKLWGGIAGVALAVLLIVWLVEGGFHKEGSLIEKEKKEAATELTAARAVSEKAEHVPSSSAPAVKDITEEKPAVTEKREGKSAALGKTAPLPKIPTVLMVVSGDEAMVPLVRTHLESIIRGSGLRVASISEIPVLMEKMQFGETPITWYGVQQFVPKGRAHILLLAQVQKTGSMNLRYYGQMQEMTTATFSARAVDMSTGTSVATPASGSIKFTLLNMEENFRKTITSATSGMGAEIRGYWEKRVGAAKKTG
jgi:serine/threonine protein kinase